MVAMTIAVMNFIFSMPLFFFRFDNRNEKRIQHLLHAFPALNPPRYIG